MELEMRKSITVGQGKENSGYEAGIAPCSMPIQPPLFG
jgi:hypothetical protein